MKGFVLAAGFGTRLRPLTDSVPKALLPVGNLPLIGYALKLLAHHGITDVIVNAHHLAKPLREALGDGAAYDVHITWSIEEEILGTGGGLKRMHEHLSDGTFVVINGDTVLDLDLGAAIQAHKQSGALATMVLRHDVRQAEYGEIEVDSEGRIRRLLGHGEPAADLLPYMFAGAHIMEPRLLEYIPPNVNSCVNRYAYTKALNNDEHLHAFLTGGYWADAGTPERYFAANQDALAQRMKLRHADPLGGFALSPKREVPEVVRMGEAVALGSNVRIMPPVLLGDATRVGDAAMVGPGSVLGPRVHVGKDAVVSESIVLDGAKIETGSRVHRTIVGKRASIALDVPTPP